jgi:hypothetical protein
LTALLACSSSSVSNVISGPICGVYCVSTVVAMVLVMLYRRGDYGGKAAVVATR